jgi:hypothetical protein
LTITGTLSVTSNVRTNPSAMTVTSPTSTVTLGGATSTPTDSDGE